MKRLHKNSHVLATSMSSWEETWHNSELDLTIFALIGTLHVPSGCQVKPRDRLECSSWMYLCSTINLFSKPRGTLNSMGIKFYVQPPSFSCITNLICAGWH